MKLLAKALVVITLGCGLIAPRMARAVDGTFVADSNRVDMVYDGVRNVIYISGSDRVLRYDVATASFLTPIVLGGQLRGMSLSPDGNTLAVADSVTDATQGYFHLVDLNTLTDNKVGLSNFYMCYNGGTPTGTNSVSYLHDGELVFSCSTGVVVDYYPGDYVDASRLNQEADIITTSGDGQHIGDVLSNISAGYWGTFDAIPFTTHLFITNGTGAFNFDIGVNANGTQFAIPTYSGTYVYDSSYQKVATLGTYAGPQPTGVAYAPVDPVAYFPWSGTGDVRVYDMQTFQQTGTYTFSDTFQSTSIPFSQGHTRVSRDGSMLMVSVTGGISYVQMYAPLGADNVTASTAGKRVAITLNGHIGNGAALTYSVQTPPSHGHAYIVGNTATYIPDPGYTGTDTFTYGAHYGQAVATATATVTVTADTSAYNPIVSFHTLPVLQASTPIPGSSHIPDDFNGDGSSDIPWFNPGTSQFGYWKMIPDANYFTYPKYNGGRLYNITPGYFVAAIGDFNGDGYADLVFTSANHDLWLWTNNRGGGFSSQQIYSYPADWQLIGAGDINGDGKADLLWLNPSTCQFAYWLMDGGKRIGSRVISVACGYYPIAIGYDTPSNRLSIFWSSANNDLYVWDATATGGFKGYDISSALQAGNVTVDLTHMWALGGGTAGQGIGLEWLDASKHAGIGLQVTRSFDTNGNQTGVQTSLFWNKGTWIDSPGSGGYFTQSQGSSLYALDPQRDFIEGSALPDPSYLNAGSAPYIWPFEWSYPDGWYVVGSPANGAIPLPWR